MDASIPGIRYRTVLLERLVSAGIDTAALWRAIVDDPQRSTRLANLLNTHVLDHHREIAELGYPSDQVEAARRVAERQVGISFDGIAALALEVLGPPEAESITIDADIEADIGPIVVPPNNQRTVRVRVTHRGRARPLPITENVEDRVDSPPQS